MPAPRQSPSPLALCLLLVAACPGRASSPGRDAGRPAASMRPPPPPVAPFPSGRDPLAPSWVDAPRGDALSPAEAARLFALGAGASGPLTEGVLACRVDATPGVVWDTSVGRVLTLGVADDAPPDLALTLSVADGREALRFGEDDRASTHMAFPRVTLRPGDAVATRAFDRDAMNHDPMGEARASWDGRWPLTLRAPNFTVTCLAAPPGEVRSSPAGALVAFDVARVLVERSLRRTETFGPELYPATRFAEGRSMLAEAAAWLGWGHPEVAARTAASNALDARMTAALREALTRARATPRGGARSTDAGAVTFRGMRCDLSLPTNGAPPSGCVAVIEVTPRDERACRGGLARVVLHAVGPAPRRLGRCWASHDGGASWEPRCDLSVGTAATLAYASDFALTRVDAPALLEVQLFFGREAALFRAAP
ncbi:MAG: hypothetical protein U0324_24700 [Polyangiales bacterium]